jgi:prepilin-type N-terminal cleavage/methylation domain-containing protein
VSVPARLRDERGYTLIEMIMATAAGLLVAAATMAILAASYKMLANGADRVDANQQGRTALLRIEQLLESSCVAGLGVSPVVGGSSAGTGAPPSGANSITFLSSLSDLQSVPPNEDVISLTGGGALDLVTYTNPTGSEPDWVFPTTATSTTVLVSHAALTPNTAAIFKYYPYASNGQLATTADQLVNGYLPSSGNSGQNSATVSAVTIQFEALASDGNSSVGNGVDFSDQVVLRLTPVSSTPPTSTPEPCS